ncbi:hypothetical protein BO83DRAFT_460451 [Aspergillus eucalypticola CBS 122712]|uniref:Uncharacterized protein n=1 Tax=Aspergillus eucalypticola (strain CBS 122712 / IBT 29274) TaxID=1448314 RepID=A0A317UKM0_ASPEC|nr:uncharacterized protein BO83DRAFT_460451 [Aspergillus eucalypticola CBS 122712]PWY61879.1 hypothetical protein BO83DRAFT_460451 [Aspergillus eucalypticola CBS 122712]
MYWTNEANAKLLVGVLEQMRGKLKLDYERLATHMGSDCTACAIEQQIAKLKRQANNSSPTKSTAGSSGNESTSITPSSTPKKRQADIACIYSKRSAKKAKLDDKNASVPPSKSVTVKRDVEPDVVFVKTETKSTVMEKTKEERL